MADPKAVRDLLQIHRRRAVKEGVTIGAPTGASARTNARKRTGLAPNMTPLNAITLATAKGFKVTYSDADHGWWVLTPKVPRRRPSQELLGLYENERAAWFDSAMLANKMKD